jgi:hypothetical protein
MNILLLINEMNPACYKMLHRASELDGFFGKTLATENRYETWNREH